MIDARIHINDLLQQANQIDVARPEKAVLLEQAVKLADSHNEIELAFKARQELVRVATFSGHPDKVIVGFSWCLAQHDKNPGKFDEWLLLWEYKWVILAVIKFPQIPLKKIEELFEDATRRFSPYEGGQRALYQLRMVHYQLMGLAQLEKQSYQQWQSAPRGAFGYRKGLSNCAACEIYDEVSHMIYCHRDAEALDAAAALLAQEVTCESSGKTIFSLVLVPLLRLGLLDQALNYQRSGYRLISTNMGFLDAIACQINYLTIINNLDKAVKLFDRHLIWALQAVALTDIFDFYLAARLLFTRLQETSDTVKMHLPKAFPQYQASGDYQVQALNSWLDEQLRSIAHQFDARNKTDRFSQRIEENAELRALFLQ